MSKIGFWENPNRRAILQLLAALPAGTIAGTYSALAGPSLQDIGSRLVQLPEITIFKAKRVITMAAKQDDVDAVAVVGSRVLAARKMPDLIKLIGKQPYRIDNRFSDKIILAGLIDQHLHPVLAALTLTVDIIAIEDWVLPTGTSKAAIDAKSYMERLKASAAAITDPTEPLITWGYHHYFHGQIRRAQLDASSKTRPIVIWHRSAHEFILNTAALERFGITPDFIATFAEGARAQSSFDGGHFFEQGMFALLPKLVPVLATKERLLAGLQLTKDYVHRSGITLACEPGGIVAKPLQDAQNFVLGGDDVPFRTYYLPDGKSMAQLHIDGNIIGETEALLTWGKGKTAFLPKQVKLFADGAIYSQLMQMSEGYTDGHSGEWIMEPELFDRAFDAYWNAGYQIHIHQNGDSGLDMVLNALERNVRRKPRHDHRTTAVHFGYARSEQVTRMAALGANVSSNPYYVVALSDRYGEVGLGKARADNLVPMGDVVRADIPFAFHSDMPMAPAQPLFLVWAAVNRTTVSGRVAGPEHRVSVEQALRAVTIEAARSIRLEDEVGSIEPGKLANFTILESDPFEVSPAAIKDIVIWGTVHEGTVYPVPPQGNPGKKASLTLPAESNSSDPKPGSGALALVAGRGAMGACGCCEPVSSFSCTGDESERKISSTVACCSTNAVGWAVAAYWAKQIQGG